MAQADPANILVIHFGQLGDVVLGLPAMQAIRDHFPAAKITVLSGRSTAGVIALAKVSDEIIAVDRVALRDGNKISSIADIFRLVSEVRGRKFDLVIDLHSLYETNLIGYLSGAKSRLYARRRRRSIDWLSNFPVDPPPEDRAEHHSDRYLKVVEAFGIEGVEKRIRFEADKTASDTARSVLRDHGVVGQRIVGLFLGAGHKSRRWSVDNFAAVANLLASRGQLRVLILLGPEERELRPGLEDTFGPSAQVIEELSLPVFVALLSAIDVFVSGDTGPMHLGAVAGASIVLLSQLGAPAIFHPLTDDLVVLDHARLEEITPESVVESVNKLLSARIPTKAL